MKIFLLRHASPDWDRKDIPYDIPPGPPLSHRGEHEARQLGEYLKLQNVAKLYFSPFERSATTARIAASVNHISLVEDARLKEWHEANEEKRQVKQRMREMFEQAARESVEEGAIGLVSHGGPTGLLLEELGIDSECLEEYRKRFDRSNPLPPAGVWKAEWNTARQAWDLDLTFMPTEY